MTNNTILNVSRELLEDCLIAARGPINGNLAERLGALLSAPSPAGVEGLDVVSNWVLFNAEADKPYIKKMLPDGFLAFFDCEEDARRAKANNPGTDHKRIDRVKAEDAQAIIDGLRGEVAEERAKVAQLEEGIPRIMEASYQFRQQRDQHAGLLREVHDTYRAAIHWEDLRATMKRIDAALSAGKEGE